jgi:hypothetical protein
MLTSVIVLTMIGPEARDMDHVKEHAAELEVDQSSDLYEDKAHADGHVDKTAGELEDIEKLQ